MKVYPKEDIRNRFDQIIWYKDKVYECSKLENCDLWLVTCELIGNEYPILDMYEILSKFYTIEDQRDMKINAVFPKENIINGLGQIIWYKDKVYQCSKLESCDLWIVTCEPVGNEYRLLEMYEILPKFYTIEDQRDMKIDSILK